MLMASQIGTSALQYSAPGSGSASDICLLGCYNSRAVRQSYRTARLSSRADLARPGRLAGEQPLEQSQHFVGATHDAEVSREGVYRRAVSERVVVVAGVVDEDHVVAAVGGVAGRAV